MDAQELYVKSGEEFKATGTFFCGKCRMTALSKEAAEACCVCDMCKEKPHVPHKIYCEECSEKFNAELQAIDKAKRQALFDAAEEVTEYEFVWWGEACVPDVQDIVGDCLYDDLKDLWWGEACVPDVQDIVGDCLYDDLKDLPEFVFAMKPVKFGGFDVSKLFDDFDEDSMCEDFTCKDVLLECDVLEEAVRAFNGTNKNTTIFWQEDTTRKVRIPDSECLQDDVDNDKPNDSPAPPLRPKGRQGIDKRY